MSINIERIANDIRAIAGITQTPGSGATRPTFSVEWRQACEYVVTEARNAGCVGRLDAHGNWHIRQKSIGWDMPVWLSGSHLDTVPHGGDYDGVAGVIAPLEVLRNSADEHRELPLELIIFAEEEGPTFGLGMLGSRSWVGDLSPEKLSELRNSQGQSYMQAGKPHGVRAEQMNAERLVPDHYIGLIELHIEQGPGMWNRDQRLAIVTAIAGRRQYSVEIGGQANHAGSTSMQDRHDALTGAAGIILQLETLARSINPRAVATVGRLDNHPNAINVIPDRVNFTIDFRAPADEMLERGDREIRRTAAEICERRNLQFAMEEAESLPAVAMDSRVCERLKISASRAGLQNVPTTVSGALHDSAIIAPHLPTAMLFVPSKDGISHNPAEFSRVEDIATAAEVLAAAVSAGPI